MIHVGGREILYSLLGSKMDVALDLTVDPMVLTTGL